MMELEQLQINVPWKIWHPVEFHLVHLLVLFK